MAIATKQERRRALSTALHPVPAPIYPVPYDGASKVDRAHVAGFYFAASSGRPFTIQYAVEVNAKYDKTAYPGAPPSDPDIGLKAGIFRLITGSPGFDGTAPFPVWDAGGTLNKEIWYEGILINDGFSNPSRRININETGDYATLSGFDFSVRNDLLFWDRLDQKKIYIVSGTVKVYAIIRDRFYQIWDGIVVTISYDETTFTLKCESNFKVIHHQFPPEIITQSSLPDVPEKTIGKTIPVCFGDVPYAKGVNISQPERAEILVISGTQEYTICGAFEYKKTPVGNATVIKIRLKTQMKTTADYIAKNAWIGGNYYLRVLMGDEEDYKRIKGNDATSIVKIKGIDEEITDVFLQDELTSWEDRFAYSETGGVANPSAWYFQVVKAPVEYAVSHKKILRFGTKEGAPKQAFNYDKEYKPVDFAILHYTDEKSLPPILLRDYLNFPGFKTISEKASGRMHETENTVRLSMTSDPIHTVPADMIKKENRDMVCNGIRTNALTYIQTGGGQLDKIRVILSVQVPVGDGSFKNADQYHLAVDFSFLCFAASSYSATWNAACRAFLRNSYSARVENDLFADEKGCTLGPLPMLNSRSDGFYTVNMLSNGYYYHFSVFGDNEASFWPERDADAAEKQGLIAKCFTRERTFLNKDELKKITEASGEPSMTLRLVARIELEKPGGGPLPSLANVPAICINVKDIGFIEYAGILIQEDYYKPVSVHEIKGSSRFNRPMLCDAGRSSSAIYLAGGNSIELTYDVEMPDDLKSSFNNTGTSLHLCIDADVYCNTFGVESNWMYGCKAFLTIKQNDGSYVPQTTDIFQKGLSILFRTNIKKFGNFNFLPNTYYANITGGDDNGEPSFWPKLGRFENHAPAGLTEEFFTKNRTVLNAEKINIMKDGKVPNVITMEMNFDISQTIGFPYAVYLSIKEVGIIAITKTEFKEEEVYVRCQGEVFDMEKEGGSTTQIQTNSVYGAFHHILKTYDGIPSDRIHDINLANCRGPGNPDKPDECDWHVGRQIDERKNSFDYLKELCKQSFTGIFYSRTGKLTLCAWLENRMPVATFNESTIIRDSIKKYSLTKHQDLYNDFQLYYSYNPGSSEFDRMLLVTNGWMEKFPDINELTGGIAVKLLSKSDLAKVVSGGKVELKPQKEDYDNKLNFLKVGSLVSLDKAGIVSFYQGEVESISVDGLGNPVISIDPYNTFLIPPTVGDTVLDGSLVYYNKMHDEVSEVQRAWTLYVSGLLFDAGDPVDHKSAYEKAKFLWELCHQSFLQTGKIQQAPESVSKLKWYIDKTIFHTNRRDPNERRLASNQSAAYWFLYDLVRWTSRQKPEVEFRIPVNGGSTYRGATKRNIDLDLLDPVLFSDAIYTDNKSRLGWITRIDYDTKKNQILLGLTLEPDDFADVIIERGIPENDPMPWINESGDRDDLVVET